MTEKKWKMKQAFEKLMEELAGCVNIIDGKRFLAVLEEFFIEIRRVQKEERDKELLEALSLEAKQQARDGKALCNLIPMEIVNDKRFQKKTRT